MTAPIVIARSPAGRVTASVTLERGRVLIRSRGRAIAVPVAELRALVDALRFVGEEEGTWGS